MLKRADAFIQSTVARACASPSTCRNLYVEMGLLNKNVPGTVATIITCAEATAIVGSILYRFLKKKERVGGGWATLLSISTGIGIAAGLAVTPYFTIPVIAEAPFSVVVISHISTFIKTGALAAELFMAANILYQMVRYLLRIASTLTFESRLYDIHKNNTTYWGRVSRSLLTIGFEALVTIGIKYVPFTAHSRYAFFCVSRAMTTVDVLRFVFDYYSPVVAHTFKDADFMNSGNVPQTSLFFRETIRNREQVFKKSVTTTAGNEIPSYYVIDFLLSLKQYMAGIAQDMVLLIDCVNHTWNTGTVYAILAVPDTNSGQTNFIALEKIKANLATCIKKLYVTTPTPLHTFYNAIKSFIGFDSYILYKEANKHGQIHSVLSNYAVNVDPSVHGTTIKNWDICCRPLVCKKEVYDNNILKEGMLANCKIVKHPNNIYRVRYSSPDENLPLKIFTEILKLSSINSDVSVRSVNLSRGGHGNIEVRVVLVSKKKYEGDSILESIQEQLKRGILNWQTLQDIVSSYTNKPVTNIEVGQQIELTFSMLTYLQRKREKEEKAELLLEIV